uniref:CCHC-type domain-containing protein n=1 Tax=Tanacetum cinerariifolium TaxID=118510 RepID=A0A6L2M7G5_TANCI|nr:hypothetical protein [Tanacetum cinerariifolium]
MTVHFEIRPVGLRLLNRAIWKNFGDSERSTLNKSVGTDLVRAAGTDLVQAAGTDLVRVAGTDLVPATGTDLVRAAGTDLVRAAGTDLVRAAGTDLVRAAGTDLVRAAGTDLVRATGTDLVRATGTDLVRALVLKVILLCSTKRTMYHGPLVFSGDANRDITVTETFHLQTNDELSDKELKQIEADDQAIQTILLGLLEDIYAAVDSCETAQEIWLRVQQMMKGSDIGIQEKKAKLFNEWESYSGKEVDELKAERLAKNQDPLALMANSNNPYAFPAPHQDQSSFNQNYLQQPMPNHEDIIDPTIVMNMALTLMCKAFKLNNSTPTNNNQRISSNPRNRQITQPGQNAGNPAGYNDVIGNQVIHNAVQNPRVQNVGNHNGLIGVQGNENQNQIGNGNLVAARAKGNEAGQNGNQIRCYNCRGVGHYARNCIVRPRRRDAAYLQTQLLIAQKEEARIQLQAEEYDLMAAAADLDEIEEVNANRILMANLQQASTSEEQYTELLEPILESHQVPQNDIDVISEDTSVEQGEETVEQHPANVEETRALYESLYHNLAIEVEKVNLVNRKLKETNADMTTELARYKNQERCFEIS